MKQPQRCGMAVRVFRSSIWIVVVQIRSLSASLRCGRGSNAQDSPEQSLCLFIPTHRPFWAARPTPPLMTLRRSLGQVCWCCCGGQMRAQTTSTVEAAFSLPECCRFWQCIVQFLRFYYDADHAAVCCEQCHQRALPNVLLHCCTAAPLHRCTAAPLHRRTAAPLHRCTAAPLHRCTAALLHCCCAERAALLAPPHQHDSTTTKKNSSKPQSVLRLMPPMCRSCSLSLRARTSTS